MYSLGQTSEQHLTGLDAGLVKCVRRAISQSSVDFTVFEGLRTLARQRELVAQGVSRTLDSYHLTGHAADLVPYIGGRAQWQAPACLQVAVAMHEAAAHFGVEVTWGAVWDRPLTALDPAHLEHEIDAYVARYRAIHGPDARPLIDYPHFQVRR
jgi:peptidoglycan L-alanyl-D-glutamate endopeptidase CwlK